MVVGAFVVFAGFVMTMYGFVHKPFWSEEDAISCSFCADDRENTLETTKNCRLVGPICCGIGIVLILIGSCWKKRSMDEHVCRGGNAMSSTGVKIATYSSTGATSSGTGYMGMQQQQIGEYQQPVHTKYPPSQGTYPPPQQGIYPQPHGTYQVQGTYPPTQGYLYPLQGSPYVPPAYPPPGGAPYPLQQQPANLSKYFLMGATV